jgi:hypothetical protein
MGCNSYRIINKTYPNKPLASTATTIDCPPISKAICETNKNMSEGPGLQKKVDCSIQTTNYLL